MLKKIVFVIAASMLCICFAQDETSQEGVQKIILKISTVETVGTRTQKTWNPPTPPMALQELPYNEQDIAKATPQEARRMSKANYEQRLSNQQAQTAIAMHAFLAAEKHYEGVKKQLEGTTFGRQVILAVDKFAGKAGEYFDPDCIEFFHRMDMDEGNKESYLKDMKTSELVTTPYFIKLVFDEPRIKTGKVPMNGQEIKVTKMVQTITYSVQRLSGKIITSGNVKKEDKRMDISAIVTDGADDNMRIELMEEALAEVAQRISNFFVAKATVKLIGPKNDADFDPETAIIEIGGTQYNADEEFSIIKGNHVIKVDMDGFKQRGKTKISIKRNGAIKIAMRKVVDKDEAD